MITSILILAFLGFCISLYGFIIEKQIKKNPQYKPACDISDTVSCSKPLLSKYGKLFFVSNSLLGVLFYLSMIILAWYEQGQLLFYGSLISVLVSIILAYILFFKIRSVCLLCLMIYVINVLMLLFVFNV